MKIIILQTSHTGYEETQKALNLAKVAFIHDRITHVVDVMVMLTDSAGLLIEAVVNNPTEEIVIISSDYINQRGFENADALATETKKFNPSVKVFTFTVSPTSQAFINGRIPKDHRGWDLMATFVADVQANGYDRRRLEDKIPKIEFLN